jgi:hypothetical protein
LFLVSGGCWGMRTPRIGSCPWEEQPGAWMIPEESTRRLAGGCWRIGSLPGRLGASLCFEVFHFARGFVSRFPRASLFLMGS